MMNPEPRNIVLLSVDALRADHLSSGGYERKTAPNIDRLADGGLLFTNAISPSSHTREAVPALLSGRYPIEAIDDKYHLSADSIAGRLKENGFLTGAFHSNPFVSRAYGYDEGFDEFDDDLHIGQHKLIALAQRAIDKLRNRHYARAEVINKRALDWIDSIGDSRFFLWNHYMDVHGPYEPPHRYQELFSDERIDRQRAQELYRKSIDSPESISEAERRVLIDLYDAEIRYLDDHISRFLSELAERELLDETLVVVTSDHGDAFGEHGYYEHPRYLHDELVRVPLIVSHPALNGGEYDETVSTLDVVPTILDAVGIRFNDYPGEPLFHQIDSPTEYADRLVFSQASGEGDEKGIKRFAVRSATEKHMLEFDAESGTVRREEIGAEPSSRAVDSLREHGREQISDVGSNRSSDSDSVDEEIQDRLKALGYRE